MDASEWKNCIAFCLFGLINNFTYVVFLSAAGDLIKHAAQHVTEGSILLADILPGLIVKSTFPYVMHRIPYFFRVLFCTLASFIALWMVSWAGEHEMGLTFFGIVLASASSGLGELSFLSLCSYFPVNAISFWSVGTGLAGVFGALAYLTLTSWLQLSVPLTLRIVSVLPFGMLFAYLFLVKVPSEVSERDWAWFHGFRGGNYTTLEDHDEPMVDEPLPAEQQGIDEMEVSDQEVPVYIAREEATIEEPSVEDTRIPIEKMELRQRIKLLKPLFVPYMIPLFLVFWAEYTINQGVAPVLLFPVDETPFRQVRDHYVYYQFLYQVGVFLSRSSVQFFRIKHIWAISLLQVLTLIFLILNALLYFIPSVWIVFVIILWEGLLGGACYVNAFNNIREQVDPMYKEFAMGACSVADTFGIFTAALTAMGLRPALCRHQVAHGRNLCSMPGE